MNSSSGSHASSGAAASPLPSLFIVYNGTTAGGQSIGGGDQVILKFIRLSGFHPDLIVPRSTQHLVQPHGRLFLTRATGGLGLGAMLWLYFWRTLEGLVRARQAPAGYDIGLAVSAIAVDLLPLRLLRARRKGVIIYHLLPERKAVNLATRIRFWLAAREHVLAMFLVRHTCDFIVAGNAYTQGQLQRMFPEKTVVILHAGFDAEAIDAVPAPVKDPKLAVFMGRLTSQKGIFDLLEIMETIQRREPEFKLVILGDGPERAALADQVHRRGIGGIEIRGFVTETEKYRYLKQAGFFFFPSYEEGWGIALAEALYAEARCICYELPHYRGIFGDFPAYVPLADTARFVETFWALRTTPVPATQKAFVRQYHDPNVVQDLVTQLQHFATLPVNKN